MANLDIREYVYLRRDGNGPVVQAGWEPAVAGQRVVYTTSTQSSPFNAETRFVRVIADGPAFLEFGDNPTADTSTGLRLEANVAEFFGVVPGQRVAAYDGTS